MDKILVFSGLWLAFLPSVKWNILMINKGRITSLITVLFYLSGVYSLLLGVNAIAGFVNETKLWMLGLNVILMILVAMAITIKFKVEKGILSRLAGVIGVVFLAASIFILVVDLKEGASSCIALTGGLIMLASPLDVITKK